MAVYKFSEPFDITTQGQDVTITYIELPMPSARDAEKLAVIDSIMGQALRSIRENSKITEEVIQQAQKVKAEKPDEKLTAQDALAMLIGSGVEIGRAYSAIKDYLKYSKAKLEGEYACSGNNLDDMPLPALKEILGAYIVNFTNILS